MMAKKRRKNNNIDLFVDIDHYLFSCGLTLNDYWIDQSHTSGVILYKSQDQEYYLQICHEELNIAVISRLKALGVRVEDQFYNKHGLPVMKITGTNSEIRVTFENQYQIMISGERIINGFAANKDSITTWQPPHEQEQLTEADKIEIIKLIEAYTANSYMVITFE